MRSSLLSRPITAEVRQLKQLRELARNSFEASFLPSPKKLEVLNLLDFHGLKKSD